MKISRLKTIVFVLGFLFCLSGLLNSIEAIEVNEDGEVIEPMGKGSINWTTRKLEACGVADPDQSLYGQQKAAQIAARAELLTIFKGIRIRGDYGVINGLLRKDISEVEIEGFLKHSYVTKPKTNELGLIECNAFVYLDKNGNTILTAQKAFPRSNIAAWQPPVTIAPSSARYTGLIIDALGLKLRPAMAPRILTEGDFLNVYGGRNANQEFALTYGFAGYAGSMEKARKMKDRIGESPLEIIAMDAVNVSDVVVSKEDAAKIASALMSYDFLKECRVLIVVN